MGYIITLDVGTTSVKACLFDEDLRMLAFSSGEYELLTPGKNIVELNPEIYWKRAIAGIKQVVGESGVTPEDIRIITLTTQGETLILVDRNGMPLHNSVVWLDARADQEAILIDEIIGKNRYYHTTGLPEVGAANPLCKVLWFKEKRPDIYDKTYKFLLLEDFLIYRLIGEFVTEQSLMSSTGYFDICKNQLWTEGLSELDISKEHFPLVHPCGQQIGKLSSRAAKELGLSTSTAVSTGAMDQVCSALGSGNIIPGIITETTGTSLVIAATVRMPDFDSQARITYYRHYNQSFLMLPYCPTAGIILKWFRDEFCEHEMESGRYAGISAYPLLDEMAAEVPPGSNGLILLPYFAGKMSPDNNPYAKGLFYGVGLDIKKQHFIRAILESIGYMLRENIEQVEQSGIHIKEIHSLGGGSSSRLWNAIKADICRKNIITLEQPESTSLGAAMLGAVSIRAYNSIDEACERHIKVKETYSPQFEATLAYEKSYGIYKMLYANLKEFFKESFLFNEYS
jgi:xylulokinase